MGRVYDIYVYEVEMKAVVSSDDIPDVEWDVPCVVEIICSNSVLLHSLPFYSIIDVVWHSLSFLVLLYFC
jgi:hypothetical protein